MERTLHTPSRSVAFALASATLLLCATPAFAWGPRGHHIVARLAEAQLTPQAWAAAQELLALRHARHLSGVANWADDLRDIDPALFQRTRRMHFVNFHSPDCNYSPPRDCREGDCAVAAIEKYSAILADRSQPPAERAEALAFVVHLVGDIHQPLHDGYRRDAGGNDFQVRWRVQGQDRGTNLHRVWDSLMLDSTRLSAAQYARKLAAARTPIATGGTPADWAEESCRIDRDGGVYPDSRFIGDAYVERELPIAERRLRQAGARLAALLNRDLANG
ncbi:MAG TPA: S1/P1 nuclease [Rhodanobacteraceae bacterium]|nr:S1/P1 nuclease [Rhodanobacteraceae bacterium]